MPSESKWSGGWSFDKPFGGVEYKRTITDDDGFQSYLDDKQQRLRDSDASAFRTEHNAPLRWREETWQFALGPRVPYIDLEFQGHWSFSEEDFIHPVSLTPEEVMDEGSDPRNVQESNNDAYDFDVDYGFDIDNPFPSEFDATDEFPRLEFDPVVQGPARRCSTLSDGKRCVTMRPPPEAVLRVSDRLPIMPSARDPHRFVNDLAPDRIERLVARLESRGKDRVFTRLFENYAAKLALPDGAHILEIGCGTGVISRALARRRDGSGRIVGVDQSAAFVDAARRFAEQETLSRAVAFEVADAHSLPFEAGRFDAVIAHTLLSHVTDPAEVLAEAGRMLGPDGLLVVFDGDYASLTYAFDDAEAGRRMDWALARATFNNPLVMRHLPALLAGAGLEPADTFADVVCEIGEASYFRSMAETYAPLIAEAGFASADEVEGWLDTQREAMENGRFFASCNYHSVIARRPQ